MNNFSMKYKNINSDYHLKRHNLDSIKNNGVIVAKKGAGYDTKKGL